MFIYIFHYAWKWTHFNEKFCHIFSLYVSFYLFINELSLWPGTNNLLCRHFEFTKKAQSKWYATQYLKFWWNLNTSFWYLLPDSLVQLVCMLKHRMRARWYGKKKIKKQKISLIKWIFFTYIVFYFVPCNFINAQHELSLRDLSTTNSFWRKW